MKIKQGQQEKWDHIVKINDDPYSARCVSYADDWAKLMEPRIESGESVSDIAEECARIADTDGITGFMYGAAVSILAACWEHGEALRRWHNHDTQIGDEGDRANETGGVLNPAMLVVGCGFGAK